MRELAAQAVLLARSFEEADSGGVLLSDDERQAATEEGRAAGGGLEAQAERRAAVLLALLAKRVPALPRVRALTRIAPWLAAPIALGALAVGISTNALGPSRSVNLLAFPLLALLVWNVSVYLLLSLASLLGLFRRSRGEPGRRGRSGPWGLRPDPGGILVSAARWLVEWVLERVRLPDPARSQVVSRALAAYGAEWTRVSLALGVARLRAFLHLGAAALASGVVAGMYVRGLGLAYRATWESTFLSAEVVSALLHLVLGPAAILLGVALPDADGLEAMAAPRGTDAAPWIHLWAATTAAVVVVPRLILAALQLARAAALARRVAVEPIAGTFRALLPADRGRGLRVEVVPYSHGPGPRQRETVRGLLHDLFGRQARVEIQSPVSYGAEPAAVAPAPTCVAVIFTLVQSPEPEVHGRYVEQWMESEEDTRILVLVDAASWRERWGEDAEQRRAERIRAWDRVLRDSGISALHVDLGRSLPAGAVDQAEGALWTRDASPRRFPRPRGGR